MITARGLTFTYPGRSEPALNGIDFEVEAGTIFGFLGPSGAGKSTTQKLLLGLLRGYGGSLKALDQELSTVDRSYFERVGAAFEFPTFYLRFTARENLRFFSSLYRGPTRNVDDLLAVVGLLDDADQQVEEFSKGMKVRLNLCRALLHNPDLVFLDEPTSGLDPVNARNIRRVIQAEKGQGRTVFLTTHNMHTAAELCDRVAFINEGEITLIDAPRELMLRFGRPQVTVEWENGNGVSHREFPLDELGNNQEFFSLLAQKRIRSIHSREATLDEVFIATTGTSLI